LGLEPQTKKPIDRWKHWQVARQTPADMADQPWHLAGGVGLLSGIGDWRAFDFDHCPDFAAVARLLRALGLPADDPWVVRSGSGEGWHVWVLCPGPLPAGALPAKTRTAGVFVAPGRGFDHLELRWQRCYTVAPPSVHPSGHRYRFVNGRPATAPSLVTADRVVAAFHAVTHTPAPPTAAGIAVQVQGLPPRAGDPYGELKARFDLAAFARARWPGQVVDEGLEVRVLGGGGLLLSPERGVWYCFQDAIGGDAIDLVGYARHGTGWDRRQPGMFRAAVREAAAFAGVDLTVPENSTARHIRVVIGMPASSPPRVHSPATRSGTAGAPSAPHSDGSTRVNTAGTAVRPPGFMTGRHASS
jgi:hypothetical protein